MSSKVPTDEILRRRRAIQDRLSDDSTEGLLATHAPDVYYLCGDPNVRFLYLPVEGEALGFRGDLLCGGVRRSDSPNGDGAIRAVSEGIRENLGRLPRVFGLTLDVLPVREYMLFRRFFPGSMMLDCSQSILGARMVKSDWELARLDRAAEATRRTFDYAREAMRPGVSEIAFSGLMEARAGELGLSGRVKVRDYKTEGYPWHVLSGESGGTIGVLDAPASGEGTSPAFPCGAGYRELKEGEPVMVDFAVQMDHYHMDETRILTMGSMSSKAEDACRAAIEIHDRVLDAVRPGVRAGELYKRSLDAASRLGYGETYLGPPGNKVRFVGHGIGLELIEPPLLAAGREDVLEPGMTFALEPKMVFEGEFAAGIESVFAVTETGYRLISRLPVGILRAVDRSPT